MRVGVVFFSGGKRDKVMGLARAVSDSLEQQGHQVTLIDGERDVNSKLTVYEYLVVGTAVTSLFTGKIDSRIGTYLNRSGMVGGKKCFAFMASAPFGAQKGLSRLMKTMEKEGMFLRFSDVLRSPEEAAEVARRLKLER